MRLQDLFPDLSADLDIESVQIDSRRCTIGTLFVALPGRATDGAEHIADAVARGASAIVTSRPVTTTVPVVQVAPDELIPTLARVCSLLTGQPERRAPLVGVTGTNGKTSVVSLVTSMARSLGWQSGVMGTLTGERTTPAAPDLYRTLDQLTRNFVPERPRVVAMEVSSHALDQRRVEGLHFAVGAFTNLTHDHLDYHGDMESYFASKAHLFDDGRCDHAVLWVDDPFGARLAGTVRTPIIGVTRQEASNAQLSLEGSRFLWRGREVASPLLGAYNIDNLLVAMNIMDVLGASTDDIVTAVSALTPVPGRFEVVRGRTTVIVDYAHTPDGLSRLLDDVRSLDREARVITVFGCGGDRDRAKRPLMGGIASEKSDMVIVTTDNPRSEVPDAIIDDVLTGVPSSAAVERDVDRRRAIERAINAAGAKDVVVVAGRGHEKLQEIGKFLLDFDDVGVVRETMGLPC